MLRSDTHFVSYCTDGLITRKKQELTQYERHMISAIIFLWNDLHNAQRCTPCIEAATRMSRRLLRDYHSRSFLFRLLKEFRCCSWFLCIVICRACRSSASAPSRWDVSCLALSSIIREGFSCMASSNCCSAAFSCAGRMTCRALYSSTGSKSALIAINFNTKKRKSWWG